jgi:hypothetical protein
LENESSSEGNVVNTRTVSGLDELINKIREKNENLTPTLEKSIREFVVNSGYPKIEIMPMYAHGMALHDKVVISESVINNRDIAFVLYVLFHEIVHSYQYKKYGAEVLYKILDTLDTTDEDINFIRKIENVADRFSIWLVRAIAKKEKFNVSNIHPLYKTVSKSMLKASIVRFATELNKHKDLTLEQKSEAMYNLIVKKV